MGSQDSPGASAMERARIAAGLTLTEVAARVHRIPQTVERWERGSHSPSRDVFVFLATLYGVEPAELVS